MAITRSYIETVIVGQIGSVLLAAGRMSVVFDGTNDDLNDPIRSALLAAGISAADPAHVSDSDLAGISPAFLNIFQNGAVYATLQKLALRLAGDVDRQADQLGVKLSQRHAAVMAMLQRMEASGMTGQPSFVSTHAGRVADRGNMPPEAFVRPRRPASRWR